MVKASNHPICRKNEINEISIVYRYNSVSDEYEVNLEIRKNYKRFHEVFHEKIVYSDYLSITNPITAFISRDVAKRAEQYFEIDSQFEDK